MPTPARTDQSALQTQINSLGERMERGFSELKEMLQGFETRVRAVETQEAGCQPLVNARLAALESKTDAHAVDIKVMKDTIAELKQTNKILTWVGGLLGSTLIIWFISQLLGLIK